MLIILLYVLIRDVVQVSKPLDIIIMLGEFNFPYVSWCPSEIFGYLLCITASDGAKPFLLEIAIVETWICVL